MQKAMLIILDGFGIGKDSPFNAIKNAKMPFYRELLTKYPHSEILTHGEYVGLPDGVMGNSEVGHMTMGAGRIIYQDLTRISKSIREKSFFKNESLLKTLNAGASKTGRVHLMGLLSDGGVHSHIDHLKALLDWCLELRIPKIAVHAFLDGRDTPPTSSIRYLQDLFKHPAFEPKSSGPSRTALVSLSGRYFAMDRDKRWDRVEKAYQTLLGQSPLAFQNSSPQAILDWVANSHSRGITDEFLEPVLLQNPSDWSIQEGDSVVFFNYRSDRAREITAALTEPDFSDFKRAPFFKLSSFCGMTRYDGQLKNASTAFGPQSTTHILGECLEAKNLKQFRIAETEKYAHVTFFFNSGREQPFTGEDRILIPSPKEVATYDLKPEMSAFEVAKEAVKRVESGIYDFMLMNFANADMVGHTGNYEAAVRAVETLDQCLAQVVGAAEKNGTHVLITADHGNAEEMCDSHGQIHTQHTLNPVPAIWVAPNSASAPKKDRIALRDGGLQDIMPTLCNLLRLEIPKEVTGRSLIP